MYKTIDLSVIRMLHPSSYQTARDARSIRSYLIGKSISQEFINGIIQLTGSINAQEADVDIFFHVPYEPLKILSQYKNFLGIAQLYYRYQLPAQTTEHYFQLLARGKHYQESNAYHLFQKIEELGYPNTLYQYFEPYTGKFLNHKSTITN